MGNTACFFTKNRSRKTFLLVLGIFWFVIIFANILNVVQYTSMKALLFNYKNKDTVQFTLTIIDSSSSTQQSQFDTTKEENHNEQNAEGIVLMQEKRKNVPAGIIITTNSGSTSTTAGNATGIFPHQSSSTSEPLHDNHKNNSIPNFQKYEGVVIVTKVLRGEDAVKVSRMLCFLQHAYNDRTQYDIVVFTTMPWDEDKISKLQKVVAPAKLTVALEGPPLEEQVAAMTPEEKDFLYRRCNVTQGLNITWFNYCTEKGSRNVSNLGYAWQAEFRSYHIWNHDALKGYKYMMWFDSE